MDKFSLISHRLNHQNDIILANCLSLIWHVVYCLWQEFGIFVYKTKNILDSETELKTEE